jgi:hypothetical protein
VDEKLLMETLEVRRRFWLNLKGFLLKAGQRDVTSSVDGEGEDLIRYHHREGLLEKVIFQGSLLKKEVPRWASDEVQKSE